MAADDTHVKRGNKVSYKGQTVTVATPPPKGTVQVKLHKGGVVTCAVDDPTVIGSND